MKPFCRVFLASIVVLAATAAGSLRAAEIDARACLSPEGLRTHGRYVDFAPADAASVERNPPPLTWPWNPLERNPWDAPGQWTFRLTVARDPKLADLVLQEQVAFNTFAMLPLLVAGKEYYWRVEWLNAQGEVGATAPVRHFGVSAAAKRYDLGVLRHLPKLGHPRFCCRPEDLPKLRELREGNTPFGEAARANREAAKVVADYGKLAVGWSFCPQIYELACAHLLWGDTDPRFAPLGVEGLVRACQEKTSRPETMPGGDYAGNIHTIRLFAAYDWLHDVLSKEQRQLCAAELTARAASMFEGGQVCFRMTAEGRDASHPMELLHLGATGAWVLYEEQPELAGPLLMGINYFLATPGPYSETGAGWTEGRGYGRSHLLCLSQTLLAPLQVGLQIPLADYGRWDQVARFFAELTPVGEDREPFGDGGAYWHKGWGFPVILACALAGDQETYQRLVLKGEALRFFSQLKGTVSYSAEPPMFAHYFPPPPPVAVAPRTRLLAPDAGFVVEHTNALDANKNMGFIFKCSPLGWTNHCHADQGSFALYAWGQLLAGNTGTYQGAGGSYGGPQDQNFNKVTLSKNSLLINGKGQGRARTVQRFQGRIVAYHADPRYVYGCGSFSESYGPETPVGHAYRHFLFVRGRYFVIFDDVLLPEPGTVQWLYHLPTACRVDKLDSGALDYRSNDVKVAFRLVGANLRSSASDKAVGLDGTDYSKQQEAPALHLRFERDQPARQQQFLAVIVPYREGAPVIESVDATHVRVTCDGQTDLIGFGTGAKDTVDYLAIQKTALAAP